MKARFSLKHLLDDLHRLEITTIEKRSLPAQKMPAPLLALHDIVDSYEAYEAALNGHQVADDPDTTEAIADRLIEMQKLAQRRIDRLSNDPAHRGSNEHAVYLRIRNSCISLSGILGRTKEAAALSAGTSLVTRIRMPGNRKVADADLDQTGSINDDLLRKNARTLRQMERRLLDESWQLSASDRAQIRKIWEIGTETVLVQSVIDIEGDVLTRINPEVARGSKPHVLEIHQTGIETSMKMWSSLIAVAGSLLAALTRAVTSKR